MSLRRGVIHILLAGILAGAAFPAMAGDDFATKSVTGLGLTGTPNAPTPPSQRRPINRYEGSAPQAFPTNPGVANGAGSGIVGSGAGPGTPMPGGGSFGR